MGSAAPSSQISAAGENGSREELSGLRLRRVARVRLWNHPCCML